MTDPYRAGSVWLLDVDFGKGGGEQEKFVVLLSDCLENGSRSVFAFATSQGRHYPNMGVPPCEPQSKCYRIDPGQEACFSKTTFVQFNNAHSGKRADLDKAAKAGKARFVHTLDAGRFRAILKCASRSIDLEGWAIALIEQTMKSLAPAKQTPPKGQPSVPSARPSAPTFVSAEILSMAARVWARCETCRSELAGMLIEVNISRVLTGHAPTPAGFLENLGAGLDLLGDCACTKK